MTSAKDFSGDTGNPFAQRLSIKIFADGADVPGMRLMNSKNFISGLTTNPTLMNKAGIKNYKKFAAEVLEFVTEKPISFEVFSDELPKMITQAKEISTWGNNVFVKIPITNSKNESTASVVRELVQEGVKVNVTAILSLKQVEQISENLDRELPSYISVFAGRIADTGRDPVPYIKSSLELIKQLPRCELIWASPREALNLYQANDVGCHVITATNEILNKLALFDYPLDSFSLDTVKMFLNDAQSAGYSL